MATTSKDNQAFFDNLLTLSSVVEGQENLDQSLQQLAKLVANTLKTANCSIMLLKQPSSDNNSHLRVQAHYGDLPGEAYQKAIPLDHGIAGQVASTGQAIVVGDIESSSFAAVNRARIIPGGFISFPILLDKRIVGVINVNTPLNDHKFSQNDLELANILGLFIAKSIQTLHLQNLLKSQFALAALAKEQSDHRSDSSHFTEQPEKVAKIMAKSFFTDMQRIGLGSDHILEAATEIISLLGQEISEKSNQ